MLVYFILIIMGQQTESKSGKEYIKAAYCHPAYLTYAEYIRRNTGLDEAQAGIKTARRNINANDTTLMAENEEELKSLLMKVKEESEKVDLKLNIQKTKIMASSPITSWQIDGEAMETVTDYFLGLQNQCQRKQWHPTPVLFPGKSHGWRSLMGCSPWGHTESHTTEAT